VTDTAAQNAIHIIMQNLADRIDEISGGEVLGL